MEPMAHPWPLFDLRLRTPLLELRLPTDDDLLALLEVARAGIHDPTTTPFQVPWDELPPPAFERNFLLHWWAVRGAWRPDRWTLTLAVIAEGRLVGLPYLGDGEMDDLLAAYRLFEGNPAAYRNHCWACGARSSRA
jgi:hypothetical protein